MTVKEVIILKLGGSVITDKSGRCMIDEERISAVAKEISARKNIFPVVIHGAGSCGHPEAKEHHIDKGLDHNNRSGIFITHAAVRKLNERVVDALRASGVEAVGIHPLDACTAKNGRLISFELGPVEMLVRHGIVPVLHGDVVMDLGQGACIVSGDQLVSYLAGNMAVDRIGLATNVSGVLKDGSVIETIDSESIADLTFNDSGNTDVTGGMKGKIEELLTLAKGGTDSSIFHINRLGDFLDGRSHGGTVVTKSR